MTKGAVIELVEPERFEAYWPNIVRQLEQHPHIWQCWWTLDALHDATVGRLIQCWAVGTEDTIDGIAFSRITGYPTGNFFQVFLGVGPGLIEATDELEATWERFAAFHDCVMAEISGRPGWEPLLRKKGFKRTGTILSRPLDRMKVN